MVTAVQDRRAAVRFRYVTVVGGRHVNRAALKTISAMVPVGVAVLALGGISLIMYRAWPLYDQPAWVAVPVQMAGLPAVLGGTALWLQQRGNYLGPVLLLFGAVWYIGNLQAFDNEVLFAIGFCLYFLNLAVFTHLAVMVPHGRLSSTAERMVVGALYTVVPATQLLRYLEVRGRIDHETFGDVTLYYSAWAKAGTYVGIPLAIASVVIVVRNFRRSTLVQRRSFTVFWWTAAAAGSAAFAGLLAEFLPYPAVQQATLVSYALAVSAAAVGLVLGMLNVSSSSRNALDRMIGRPDDLEGDVATAVGDPGLKLYTWAPEGWCRGSEIIEKPVIPQRYAKTMIYVDDAPAVLLVHDRVFAYQHLSLHAISAMTVVAVERQRLESARSLAFVDGQDAERRRIRRDLHDRAQGPLSVLRRDVERVRGRLPETDTDNRDELGVLGSYVQTLISEMERIVDDLYPEGLAEEGLAGMVARMARQLKLDTVLDIPYVRWPDRIERTACFLISEALTNVVKHARTKNVSVSVAQKAYRLCIKVRDDGVGIDGSHQLGGTGLRGMQARAAALGGSMRVDSRPGHGTCLSIELPLHRTIAIEVGKGQRA